MTDHLPLADDPVEPVPAGARLLHIGLPKTGSTALQYAASRL